MTTYPGFLLQSLRERQPTEWRRVGQCLRRQAGWLYRESASSVEVEDAVMETIVALLNRLAALEELLLADEDRGHAIVESRPMRRWIHGISVFLDKLLLESQLDDQLSRHAVGARLRLALRKYITRVALFGVLRDATRGRRSPSYRISGCVAAQLPSVEQEYVLLVMGKIATPLQTSGELVSCIEAELAELGPDGARMFYEHFIEGRTYQDIADAWGLKVSTVFRKVADARLRCSNAISREFPELVKLPGERVGGNSHAASR